MTTRALPFYLAKKLASLEINNLAKVKTHDPIRLFQWLKYIHPSINYQVLFDLYRMTHNSSIVDISLQQELIQAYKNSAPSYPPLLANTINWFLAQALEQANLASAQDEIPIGAIVTQDMIKNARQSADFSIIGKGYNHTKSTNNICAHAEILALQKAAYHLGTHRLTNCDLYVTIEPCLMCVGAILHSRIRRVIFGAVEPKTGALISQVQILNNHSLNHHTEIIGPINNNLYKKPLREFLQHKRA